MAAIRGVVRLPPLLAERSLRRSRLTSAGLAGIRRGPEEPVTRARIAIVAVARSRDADAAGSELGAAHGDHGAVITRAALVPVVAGGIAVQRARDAFAVAVTSIGERSRPGADVAVVARGPGRGEARRRADAALAHGCRGAGGAGGALRVVGQIVACAVDASRHVLLAAVELRTGVAIVAPAGVRMTGVARIATR